MRNFIFVKDKVFSKKICNDLINTLDTNLETSKDYQGYEYKDINNMNLKKFIINNSQLVIKEYIEKYPEINLTKNKFALTNIRFKKFNIGKSFSDWHSEHCKDYPLRVLNVMYYLTDHNCGTEFYDGTIIKSKIGRGLIFPSYFTHTHKGQVCPDRKTRYILTGYFNFI